MNYTRLLPLLALVTALPAAAQNHPTTPEWQDVTILNAFSDAPKDTINIYEVFVENAPKSYNIPGAPRFAIRGKDNKFYLGIGGKAKVTLSYDWGNPIDNAYDFTTSAIPMNQPKGNGGLLQFSAATSTIYLNFVALPGTKNQVGVYLNFNFTGNGNNYGVKLYYGYLKFYGFTAGYDFSLFSDIAAIPPTIDKEGPSALVAIPNTVLDYRHSFGPHWSVGIGAELPMASATTGDHTYMVSQRVPDIPAFVQYAWGRGKSWVRLSGIMRNMMYRDQVADRNRDQVGWGVKLSGSASLAHWLTTYYQAAYGKGITSYYQDLYKGGLDMTPAGDGRLDAVKSWGGYIGLQYNISPKVYASTTYSHLRVYPDRYSGGSTPWGEQYKYAQYGVANVIWNITSQISAGIEYIYGRRVDMNGLSRHDNRLQTMFQITI